MRYLPICFIVIIADQVSKYTVTRFIDFNEQVKVLGNFIILTNVRNPGAVFGIPVGPFFLYIVCAACIILFIYTIRKRSVLFSVILGGAIGNLIDRIRLDSVIDFIDIQIGNFTWPTFNLADSCITIGVILLLIIMLRKKSVVE